MVKVEASSCQARGRLVSHGFFWQPSNGVAGERYVATTLHSVAACKSFSVTWLTADGRTWGATVDAKVVHWLRSDDLALLVLMQRSTGTGEPPKALTSASASPPDRGYFAIAAHDEANAVTDKPLTLRRSTKRTLRDEISSKAANAFVGTGMDKLPDSDVLFFDGNLTPGASGGPVVDGNGHLVGIAEGGLAMGTIGTCWATRAENLAKLATSSDQDLSPDEAKALTQMFFADVVLDQNFALHSVGRVSLAGFLDPQWGSDKIVQGSLMYAHGWEVFPWSKQSWWALLLGSDVGLREGRGDGRFIAPDGSTLETRSENAFDSFVGLHLGLRLNRIKSTKSSWRSLRGNLDAGSGVGLSVRGGETKGLLQLLALRGALTLPVARTWGLGLTGSAIREYAPSSSFQYRADGSGADRMASRWSWRGELGLAIEKEFE